MDKDFHRCSLNEIFQLEDALSPLCLPEIKHFKVFLLWVAFELFTSVLEETLGKIITYVQEKLGLHLELDLKVQAFKDIGQEKENSRVYCR